MTTGTVSLNSLIATLTSQCADADLRVDNNYATRAVASLLGKRFLILSGLSGSGKTKVGQALAAWFSPDNVGGDPFVPGRAVAGSSTTYYVQDADRLGVELWNTDDKETATRVLLPKEIIEEWVAYIQTNNLPSSTPSIEIRDAVQADSKFSNQQHSFHAPLKAAAFALLNAVDSPAAGPAYLVIPVGADWTGNENILGYPDGLDSKRYVVTPALRLILEASQNRDLPYFLLLDEMNLSHVERYFADFLSAIESGEAIPLYEGAERKAGELCIPQRLQLPDNLFVIGTVNVDETTYMFSPKVLDRANVIEFRMEPEELQTFLAKPSSPRLEELAGKGAQYGPAFVAAARNKTVGVPEDAKVAFETEMMLFFNLLRKHNAEFGYRVGYEAARFVHFYKELGGYKDGDNWFDAAMDAVIVQKMLPKLHGSRSALESLLMALIRACGPGFTQEVKLKLLEGKDDDTGFTSWLDASEKDLETAPARYPLSYGKLVRMYRKLLRDQFVTFSEA